MGMTVCLATREELIERLLSSRHHETVASHLVEDRLWAVKRYVRNGAECKYIALFVLYPFPPNEYGYKDMDESQHPFHYDCPLSFIDMTEPYQPLGSASEWRAAVRSFHAGASRKDLNDAARERIYAEVVNG